jgi:RNA polymerase sigma-70 factor (ECF subfamily)
MDLELSDDIADRLQDPSDDPETALQRKNTAEVLRQGLAQLSPSHAEVVDLVYYRDKSVKEVAEITGISEATVKTRMFYARKKLAEFVQSLPSGAVH